ncbi:nitrate/nitrite transporter NrtS [Rhizorhabdus dicambivorans]|uniref:Phosphoenolpyruvate protein kinase n=1 Tax=Rhizorhabdus dicambivorans TaxID=1850238 RepID=A0A2A4FTT5_9SPHN|nr:nitrate/nitrite transporter NrtS [Rhizorhabdus dicambivorans]ATE67524.1 hypothetical protein CMV14_22555 [Rhizorhabdus dicambivorans]PCE40858.1 hypothetical protein COO09_18490 [Rhizorhabdus dicambivorans]
MAGLLNHMLSRPVVTGAIKVSLFVGTCLNAINQGSALWHGAGVEWGKVLLNYTVPYLVASYSAAKARKALER